MKYGILDNAQVCWLYDFLLVRGGAEQVTLQVAQTWPQVDVQVATAKKLLLEQQKSTISCLSEQKPLNNPLARAYQTGRIFRRFAQHLENYDIVVFSGMYAPQAILNQAARNSIYYAHTIPLPFAFDWEEDYLSYLPAGPARSLFRRYAKYQRSLFSDCISRMDKVIANSHFVASRYHKHLGINPEVIYPPVDLNGFEWHEAGDEFVVVSTLAKHKRVDLAIEAFAGLPGQKLRIVGDGPELKRLKTQAAGQGNIHFEGGCEGSKVREIIGKSCAVICVSKDEAFGIVGIEALAAGKPVIAVDEGSYPELIVEGVTGVIVPAEIEPLRVAVLEMTAEKSRAKRHDCQKSAEKYSPEVFFGAMSDVIDLQLR
jgi:glycosyltransferase involved in cell wall biosynthesis